MVEKVVILKKNWRAKEDPRYINLLHRIRQGIAWDGRKPMTDVQRGNGDNYKNSDFRTLQSRRLHAMNVADRDEFKDAPMIVGTKVIRDILNRELTKNFAHRTGVEMHDYHSIDKFRKAPLEMKHQARLWNVRASLTKDALGRIPMAPGMKVMITENVAIKAHVVNGAEGTLTDIKYTVDSQGRHYAKCAYVHIPGSNIRAPGLAPDIVPIMPVSTSFGYISPRRRQVHHQPHATSVVTSICIY